MTLVEDSREHCHRRGIVRSFNLQVDWMGLLMEF